MMQYVCKIASGSRKEWCARKPEIGVNRMEMDLEMALATTRTRIGTVKRRRSGLPIRHRMLAMGLFSNRYAEAWIPRTWPGIPGPGKLGKNGLFESSSKGFPHTGRYRKQTVCHISDWRKSARET